MKIPPRILFPALLALGVALTSQAQTINGCVDKNGTLRVVISGEACKNSEVAIFWNTVGPQGPTGATGVSGRDGRDGRDGPPGKDGKDGAAASCPTTPPPAVIGSATLDDDSAGIHETFDLYDTSIDIQNTISLGSGSGGAGAGKVTFKEFTIKKTIDKASPDLFRYCASGLHFDKVKLTVKRATTDATIEAGTVFVSDVKYLSAPDPVRSLEQITFAVGAIKVSADGQSSCWNVVTNTSACP